MIRKIVVVLTVFLLMLSLSSCSMFFNATEKYLIAMSNTSNADSMESKSECTINIDLSKASEKVKTDLDKYKDITLNIDEAVDSKSKKGIVNIFANAGEIVLNAKIYQDGEKTFMKISGNDKYIDLLSQAGDMDSEEAKKTYEEENKKLYNEMAVIWKDSIEKEILSSEGSTIENTPDGDIKVSQLSLELTDEKAKNILTSLAEVFSKNEFIKKTAIENSTKYAQVDKPDAVIEKSTEDWFVNLPENMKKYNDSYTLEKLKLEAKVDKDSYIIDETITGILTIKNEGEIKIIFSMHTTRWNINSSSIKIDIPKIEKKDIMDVSDINSGDSDFFKKFIKDFNK